MLRLKHFLKNVKINPESGSSCIIVKMRLEIIIKPQGLRLDPITRDKDCGNQRNTKFWPLPDLVTHALRRQIPTNQSQEDHKENSQGKNVPIIHVLEVSSLGDVSQNILEQSVEAKQGGQDKCDGRVLVIVIAIKCQDAHNGDTKRRNKCSLDQVRRDSMQCKDHFHHCSIVRYVEKRVSDLELMQFFAAGKG